MFHVDQQSFARCDAVAIPVPGVVHWDLVWADGLIEGMLGAGLGLSSLGAFLGCSNEELRRELEEHGVGLTAEQGEKPLRLRKNGWSVDEHRRLIAGWVGGVSVAVLAESLARSKSSIYQKRKRLGLPARKRVRTSVFLVRDAAIGRAEVPDEFPFLAQDERPVAALEVSAALEPPHENALPVATESALETTRVLCERSALQARKAEERDEGKQTDPLSELDRTLHPELCAAIDDFIRNLLPAGVDQKRNRGTKAHVISSVAFMGGMTRQAISAATGFSVPRVNGHIDRSHLCGIPAEGTIFDVALYAEQLKLYPPKCEPTSKRLVFHRPGKYQESVVAKRTRCRKERHFQKKLEREQKLHVERAEWERSRNIVTRKGVSLPRLKWLDAPGPMGG